MLTIRSLAVGTLLLLVVPAFGQDAERGHHYHVALESADLRSDRSTGPITAAAVVVGRVLGPDGEPADGAVVLTSAGGSAVTDPHGVFNLAVELPTEAESVQVTAIMTSGTENLIGKVHVGELVRFGSIPAGTIVLTQETDCQPGWVPMFGTPSGFNNGVEEYAVFDDGTGPALYAGGSFTTAGGISANHVARWDGSSWSTLSSGMNSTVFALAVFDDGGGPALYAGGSFTTAGDVPANHIAKWNGANWSALGGGVGGAEPNYILDLAVFDDGSGPALYAGGYFSKADSVNASKIAKWNGTMWSKVSGGMSGPSLPTVYVSALAVFDDGSGPALYAGGGFTGVSDVSGNVNHIAKWDGAHWSALGNGVGGATGGAAPRVFSLAVFDDGSGPALYAGGPFTNAGGVSAELMARWDGTSWSAVGSGITGSSYSYYYPYVSTLTVFDTGSGSTLYAGGNFTMAGSISANCIAMWDGTSWSALGSGVGGGNPITIVSALAVHDSGSGQELCVGGQFVTAGGVLGNGAAKWDGASWSGLGMSGGAINSPIIALKTMDDGDGPALFAAGQFTGRVAKWSGSTWSAFGNGLFGSVSALAIFDSKVGNGPELYTTDTYYSSGWGGNIANIKRWNGTEWVAHVTINPIDYFEDASIDTLSTIPEGGGIRHFLEWSGRSYAGSSSSLIGWNGSSYKTLGYFNGAIHALISVISENGANVMYAGSGGQVAQWNGATWTPVGDGVNGSVLALTLFDDGRGDGPELYVAGSFTNAGGLLVNNIVRWDGSNFQRVGAGLNGEVAALAVYDDGSGRGPALYAGGSFTTAGGVAANRIAKWDGMTWSPLGSGVSDTVTALTVFDDGNGSGPALYVAGHFLTAYDSGDSYLAKWGCPVPSPWTNLGFALPGANGAPLLVGTGTLVVGTPLSLSLSNAATSAQTFLFLAASSAPLPCKGGTVVPVPPLYSLSLATSVAGEIQIPFAAWPPSASGLSLFFQYAIMDAGAVHGVALSNALRADVP